MATLAIQYPIFQPAMRVINAITNSDPAVITTSFPHQYTTGMVVRLNIPQGYGMLQADQLYGPITVLSDTTFSMPINSTDYDIFSVPIAFPFSSQYAQVTVIGEVNRMLSAAERNVLPY